jgi:hypothetical protein
LEATRSCRRKAVVLLRVRMAESRQHALLRGSLGSTLRLLPANPTPSP